MNKMVETSMAGTVMQQETSGMYFGICIRCSANLAPKTDTIKATKDALLEHNDICPNK